MTAKLPIKSIIKLIPLLSSNFDGEVVATARAIDRTLRSHGCTWHDLCAALESKEQMATANDPPPSSFVVIDNWIEITLDCINNHKFMLSSWEYTFIKSIMTRTSLTDRQMSTLVKIARKCGLF